MSTATVDLAILDFIVEHLAIAHDVASRSLEALALDAGATAEVVAMSRAVCDRETAIALLTDNALYFLAVTPSGEVRLTRRQACEIQAMDQRSRSVALDRQWFQLVDIHGRALQGWLAHAWEARNLEPLAS